MGASHQEVSGEERVRLDQARATLREEIDMIGDEGARRLLVVEAIGRALPIYTQWAGAARGPADAFGALERAGRDALPATERAKLQKVVAAAAKEASKAAGYDRKTRRNADRRARAAAQVCSAIDGALGRYLTFETVTLGMVSSALEDVGASVSEIEGEVRRSIARAKELGGSSDEGWQEAFAELTKTLVPPRGESASVQGEIVRGLGNLADEAMRNGNVNFGDHHRAMVAHLKSALADEAVFNGLERTVIERALLSIENDRAALDRTSHRVLARYAVRYCRARPEPRPAR